MKPILVSMILIIVVSLVVGCERVQEQHCAANLTIAINDIIDYSESTKKNKRESARLLYEEAKKLDASKCATPVRLAWNELVGSLKAYSDVWKSGDVMVAVGAGGTSAIGEYREALLAMEEKARQLDEIIEQTHPGTVREK